jgi:hypothetical protein
MSREVTAMIRDAWTTTITMHNGEDVIVIKVAKGSARHSGLAQRAINALRARVSVEKLALEVVVMDGEPTEQPLLFGSAAEAEEFVRAMMPMLASHRWQLIKLDW